MIKNKFVSLALSAIFFVVPLFANAEDLGLIPCGSSVIGKEDACTFCDLLALFQRVMNWGLTLLFVIVIAGILISGITYMVSAGNPGLMEKAKGYLKICVIGALIVLGAWLLVNTILWLMGANIQNTWYIVEGC